MIAAGSHPRFLLIPLLGVLLAVIAPGRAFADGGKASYEQANKAWFDGDHSRAAGLYKKSMEEAGGDVPAVLYNLGNCYFELEQHGRAVFYYRKTMQGDDREAARRAEANLTSVRRALLEKHKKRIEKGILQYDESHGVWYALFTVVGSNLSLILFLLFSLPFFLSLFLWTFAAAGSTLRHHSKVAFLSLLAPALLFGTLYFGRVAVEQNYTLGIVVAEEAQLRDAPDPNAPSVPLAEGLEVRILLCNEQGYFKLEMSDGSIGYVADSQVWQLQ